MGKVTFRISCLAIACALLWAASPSASATSVVVNTSGDGASPGSTSLRSAIAIANASATPTTITFDPTVFASPRTIALSGSQLEITSGAQPVTISGPAAALTVSGSGKSRVFQVDSTATVTFSNLVITGGSDSNGAAGVYNNGVATLERVTVSGGTNAGDLSDLTFGGGGIYNAGTMHLADVAVADNRCSNTFAWHWWSQAWGGGICNSGTMTLTRVTISGNSVLVATGLAYGGGIYNSGTMTLADVTVCGNAASGGSGLEGVYGGGVYNIGTISLINATVAGNTASGGNTGASGYGGGLYNYGNQSDFTIANTIVAANSARTDGRDACGSFNSTGCNLIGTAGGSAGFDARDLTGTDANPLDARLAPLADNGGPTKTMALPLDSPAIDAGGNANASGLTTDQRGLPRLVNGTVDIGAFESQSIAVTVRSSQQGLSISVDGITYASPYAATWVYGDTHTIGATSPQSSPGVQGDWLDWSDSGQMSHQVTALANAIYTANFRTQYYLTTGVGTGSGSVSPPSGWQDCGATVTIAGTPESGWAFGVWEAGGSGSYSGGDNEAQVTMNGPITETANFNVLVTVQTNVAGASFTVDGAAYTTTQVLSWVPGATHTISTTSQQTVAPGVQCLFLDWSDGAAVSHQIAPTGPAAYTASFKTQYYLTTAAVGTGNGSVSPPSGWYDSAAQVTVLATAAAGSTFVNWTCFGSGSYAGAGNPASVTMNAAISEDANFAAPLAITTARLPGAVIGAPYCNQVVAAGGTPPYAWSLASGTLPAGLNLDPTGAISGTPTKARTNQWFTVQVADSQGWPGRPGPKRFSITVLPADPRWLAIDSFNVALPAKAGHDSFAIAGSYNTWPNAYAPEKVTLSLENWQVTMSASSWKRVGTSNVYTWSRTGTVNGITYSIKGSITYWVNGTSKCLFKFTGTNLTLAPSLANISKGFVNVTLQAGLDMRKTVMARGMTVTNHAAAMKSPAAPVLWVKKLAVVRNVKTHGRDSLALSALVYLNSDFNPALDTLTMNVAGYPISQPAGSTGPAINGVVTYTKTTPYGKMTLSLNNKTHALTVSATGIDMSSVARPAGISLSITNHGNPAWVYGVYMAKNTAGTAFSY